MDAVPCCNMKEFPKRFKNYPEVSGRRQTLNGFPGHRSGILKKGQAHGSDDWRMQASLLGIERVAARGAKSQEGNGYRPGQMPGSRV